MVTHLQNSDTEPPNVCGQVRLASRRRRTAVSAWHEAFGIWLPCAVFSLPDAKTMHIVPASKSHWLFKEGRPGALLRG